MTLKLEHYLKPGEELWQIYQRHVATYLVGWLIGGVLVALGFFFIWPLFRFGTWGVAGFAVIIVVGLFMLFRTTKLFRGNVVLVTSEGLVDISRSGLWGEAVSRLSYADIQDVSWFRHGFWAVVFRYGTVQVLGAAGTVHLAFPGLPNPHEMSAKVTSWREQVRNQSVRIPSARKSTLDKVRSAERSKVIGEVFGPPPTT